MPVIGPSCSLVKSDFASPNASRANPFNDPPMHIRQPEITALITDGESHVVNAAKLQHWCVQIVDVHVLSVLNVTVAEFIGVAPRHTRLGAAVGHPDAEPLDVMLAPVSPVRETVSLREIADRFLTNANNFLPVVDAEHRLLGVVALHDLKEHLGAGAELSVVIASDVMRPPPRCATPNQRLVDVLPLALISEQQNIPVVNTLTENRLVGALSRAQVLGLFSERIAAGSKTGI